MLRHREVLSTLGMTILLAACGSAPAPTGTLAPTATTAAVIPTSPANPTTGAASPTAGAGSPDATATRAAVATMQVARALATVSAAASNATATVAASAAASPVEFVWRTAGDPHPLVRPFQLATDAAGNLYVVDSGNHRVQVFAPDGRFLRLWGGQGEADGQFVFRAPGGAHPGGIAVDGQGVVHVLDSTGRVQLFAADGTFLRTWSLGRGTGVGQVTLPLSLLVDRQGDVYISDWDTNRVQKFDAAGRLVAHWGGYGTGPGQFDRAGQLAADPEGHIYVADIRNNRVQKFTADGHFLAAFGAAGSGPGQFRGANGLAVDGRGTIYVADNDGNRVQQFDREGRFLGMWGSRGAGDGQFDAVLQLAVDGQGNIYVASDGGSDRVQKFRPRPAR